MEEESNDRRKKLLQLRWERAHTQRVPKKKRCFLCGQIGHLRMNCWKNGDVEKQGWIRRPHGKKCYKCGQRGHIRAQCRYERREEGKENRSTEESLGKKANASGEKADVLVEIPVKGVKPFWKRKPEDRKEETSSKSYSTKPASWGEFHRTYRKMVDAKTGEKEQRKYYNGHPPWCPPFCGECRNHTESGLFLDCTCPSPGELTRSFSCSRG